jgi:NAD(P)-dependent dehydrogenase (short-subunit alcohol dehydrogenase family)
MNGFCLVTPASRGIGFALAKHLLQHTNTPVVATARRDCEGTRQRLLDGIPGNKNLHVVPVDVTGTPSLSFFLTVFHLIIHFN